MMRDRFETCPNGLRRAAARLMQAVALALALAAAIPGWAANDRAVKSRVAPIYPEIAKRMKIGGTVQIEATVDPEGKVSDVKTLSGNHILMPAAEDAVRKWKFAPAADTSTVKVEVNFAIAQ